MPESRRIGLDNPHLAARVRRDPSVVFVRRVAYTKTRQAIDGFAAVKTTGPAAASRTPRNTIKRSFNASKPALPRQTRSAVLARHAVQTGVKRKKSRNKKQLGASFLLVSVAGLVLAAGGTIGYLGWKTKNNVAASVNVLSSSIDNEGNEPPAEEEITPDVLGAYYVAPDMPRFIKIPRLDVTARIKRLGVKSSGELMAPSNIYDAGWYDGSSKPRDGGTMLINGHVSGPSEPGVFYRLGNLKQGDTIDVERGDGKIFTYKVIDMESVDQDKVDMAKALASIEAGKGGLNLITCTGRYDIRTNKYEQRLIIYAVQQ